MARKILSVNMNDSSLAWLAVLVGAISLVLYFKRRTTTPPKVVLPQLRSLHQTIKDGKTANWNVCVTWDALQGTSLLKENLAKLCAVSTVFIVARATEAESKVILSAVTGIERLERHCVLFCTTEKGVESICRQISPTLLITTKVELCSFLARFLPFLIVVSPDEHQMPANVLRIVDFSDVPLLR